MRRTDLLVLFLLPFGATAQSPQWRAPVDAVPDSGYRAIVLSPDVVGRSAPDLRDLRLVDDRGSEVPYVLEVEPKLRESVRLVPFTLVRNEVVPGKNTIVEIDAGSDALVDELHLSIRNAQVTKPMRVTGSDDRENWYMLRDLRLDLNGDRTRTTSELRIVDLPLSRYRYYRIVLNDSLSAPVQVLDVGHSGRVRSEGRYIRLPEAQWEQRNEKGRSTIHISAPYGMVIERLTYAVEQHGPYQRSGHVQVKRIVQDRQGRRRRKVRERTETETLDHVVLTSHDGGMVEGLQLREDPFDLLIDNASDAPLVIQELVCWQRERRILADLRPGRSYWLTTGDENMSPPRYDLVHFKDSIDLLGPSLGAGPMMAIEQQVQGPGDGLSEHWVWVGIVLLMVLMAWSAWRMLRPRATEEH